MVIEFIQMSSSQEYKYVLVIISKFFSLGWGIPLKNSNILNKSQLLEKKYSSQLGNFLWVTVTGRLISLGK